MKIQDIQKDSNFNEVTYATVSVRGVAGYASAINTNEVNVTKKVASIKDDISLRYGGTVKQFRKTITLEDGNVIRLFWFNNKQNNNSFTVYRKAI